MTDIDKLQTLAADLGQPGVDKLYIAAKRRGINVTKKQVAAALSRIGERQIFRPIQPSKGKSASEGVDVRFQMDLIDLHNDTAFDKSGAANKFILIVINVFTREIYARSLAKKDPTTVSLELASILDELPIDPKIIASDNGNEFKGPVSTLLEKRQIAQRFKAVGDVNALGVIDRAIQTLKKTMAKIMADGRVRNWQDALKKAVASYNHSYHSTVHDAPSDVRADPKVTFMNMQDNAKKLQHNQSLFDRRKVKLEQAGAFRAPLANSTKQFKRGYQATYGDATKVKEVHGSTVVGENGVSINLKRVLPVPEGSTTATGRLGEVNTTMADKKRAKTERVMRALYDFIGDKEKVSLVAAGRHLRQAIKDYDQLLGANKLVDVIRLYPEFLKFAGTSGKDYYYVSRVA